MAAIITIGLIIFLIALIWGGFVLRSYILERYEYNIFSISNLSISAVAAVSLFIAIAATDDGAMTTNSLVLLVFAVIIYLVLFIMNSKKISFMLAGAAVIYQALASILIIIVILWYLNKIQSKKSA